MNITATEARKRLSDIERRFEEGGERKRKEYGWGANVVSDRDEDYVFDALFDVPNN